MRRERIDQRTVVRTASKQRVAFVPGRERSVDRSRRTPPARARVRSGTDLARVGRSLIPRERRRTQHPRHRRGVGPIHAPWLMPRTPVGTSSATTSVARNRIAASASSPRSTNDCLVQSPSEPPTPGLSYDREATPCSANRSAQSDQCPASAGPDPCKKTRPARTSQSGGNTTDPDSFAPAWSNVTFMRRARGDQMRRGRDRRGPDAPPLAPDSDRGTQRGDGERREQSSTRAGSERPRAQLGLVAIASSHSACFSRSRARTAGVFRSPWPRRAHPRSLPIALDECQDTRANGLSGVLRGRAARQAATTSPTSSSHPSTTSSL